MEPRAVVGTAAGVCVFPSECGPRLPGHSGRFKPSREPAWGKAAPGPGKVYPVAPAGLLNLPVGLSKGGESCGQRLDAVGVEQGPPV